MKDDFRNRALYLSAPPIAFFYSSHPASVLIAGPRPHLSKKNYNTKNLLSSFFQFAINQIIIRKVVNILRRAFISQKIYYRIGLYIVKLYRRFN